MQGFESRVARLALGLIEFLPLLVFSYAGRLGAEIAERFYWGAAAVFPVVLALLILRIRPNPLSVAANIWLCVEALGIRVYIPVLAEALIYLQESAFFVAIMAVGAAATAFSKSGMFRLLPEDSEAARRLVRIYSLALLALAMIGFAWSRAFQGDETVAAVFPAILLFLAQMVLDARLHARARKA